MSKRNSKGRKIIENKARFGLFIFLNVVILIMAVIVFWPENNAKRSTDANNQEATTSLIDSVSKSKSDSSLRFPKTPYNFRTDERADEDKADNDDDNDPYDDPDWNESTPGESRPEYFIRGNIPDPELYPEDVVKEWVKEHGTEDEIRDVENGDIKTLIS